MDRAIKKHRNACRKAGLQLGYYDERPEWRVGFDIWLGTNGPRRLAKGVGIVALLAAGLLLSSKCFGAIDKNQEKYAQSPEYQQMISDLQHGGR